MASRPAAAAGVHVRVIASRRASLAGAGLGRSRDLSVIQSDCDLASRSRDQFRARVSLIHQPGALPRIRGPEPAGHLGPAGARRGLGLQFHEVIRAAWQGVHDAPMRSSLQPGRVRFVPFRRRVLQLVQLLCMHCAMPVAWRQQITPLPSSMTVSMTREAASSALRAFDCPLWSGAEQGLPG